MKRKNIKIISFILTLVFLASCFPSSVFASARADNVSLSEGEISERATESEHAENEESTEIMFEQAERENSPEAERQDATRSGESGGPIPDGIYAFKNLGNTNRWMDIQYCSTVPGYHVQQYSYDGVSPVDGTENYGLFKVTQIGTTGRYTIRLMINQNLSFQFVEDKVKTVTIAADDADVPDTSTFTFTQDGGGYVIKPYRSSYCVSANSTTASGSSGAPDSYLVKKTLASAGNCARWIVEGKSTVIPDGVYAIKNYGNTNRWMDIQYNSAQPGYHVQQYEYSQSPAADETMARSSRGGLFKISKAANENGYVIRLMTNNKLGVTFDGMNVMTKIIPEDDNAVSATDTYEIVFQNGAYILRKYDSLIVISVNATSASGSSGAPSSYLFRKGVMSVANYIAQDKWVLERYTGATINGTSVSRDSQWSSTGIVEGTGGNLELVSWSTVINANKNEATIDSSTSSIATLTYNSTDDNYFLQSNNVGRLRVNIKIKNASTNATLRSSYYVFWVVPEEGTYYIQNKGTQKHMDIEGPSTASGAIIQQWDFSAANQKKWIVEHVESSNGYVRLKSVYSGLYVGVDSSNTSLIKQYATQNNYTLWHIDRSATGSLIFRCKATESSLALSVPTNSNINGTDLTQISYTNDSNYRDEWRMYVCKDASLIALPESYDRSGFFSCVIDDLETIGYIDTFNNHLTIHDGMSEIELTNRLRFSKITLVRSHGNRTFISASDGYLSTEDLDAMPSNNLIYSQLVIYGSCKAGLGRDSDSNLVNSTHNAGSSIVIGFDGNVYADEINVWCYLFFNHLVTGCTVEQACQEAQKGVVQWLEKEDISHEISTDTWYIAGNGNTTFTP